ncbi:hypothetical protein D3C72_1820930 [compost metagenome]
MVLMSSSTPCSSVVRTPNCTGSRSLLPALMSNRLLPKKRKMPAPISRPTICFCRLTARTTRRVLVSTMRRSAPTFMVKTR